MGHVPRVVAVRAPHLYPLLRGFVLGSFVVPDGLWTVPLRDCFARVQVLQYIFHTDDNKIWDLSDPAERIGYYELALVHGLEQMLLDSVVREAWQPVIDAAAAPQDKEPRDPGGLSARIAGEIGIAWPPPTKRRRRR